MIPRRFVYLSALAASSAQAQPQPAAGPDLAALAERAAKRFPQPVRVGDLIGRQVLEPRESQPVLGRVAAMVRRPDGGLDMIMRYGGVLGIGTRPIAVPVEAIALLGEYVVVKDFTREQLSAFSKADAPSPPLAPDETIRVGLTRPFH